jgi:signal transduction histidine kinase
MGQTEITIFIIIINVVLLVFITGIIIFIFQYRKRKLLHQKEKGIIEEQHHAEMLNIQLEIQQQTMQFIGREIHDSVAQKLTLASIHTQRIEFENKYPELLDRLKGISKTINDSLDELRELSKSLTDTKLQTTSLTDLLQTECNRVNETGICKAILKSSVSDKMSNSVKSFILRIVQEFIQNSIKHSGCRNIIIELSTDEKGFSLVAADDGKGFDIDSKKNMGMGLNNMQRRIQLIGGISNLQSSKEKGTSLHLLIPKEQLNIQSI